jgi:hypothetical protein
MSDATADQGARRVDGPADPHLPAMAVVGAKANSAGSITPPRRARQTRLHHELSSTRGCDDTPAGQWPSPLQAQIPDEDVRPRSAVKLSGPERIDGVPGRDDAAQHVRARKGRQPRDGSWVVRRRYRGARKVCCPGRPGALRRFWCADAASVGATACRRGRHRLGRRSARRCVYAHRSWLFVGCARPGDRPVGVWGGHGR